MDLATLPDDDKLVLFDRHRQVMLSMAENVAAATPEQLRELMLMLVVRAETRGWGLGAVTWTGPARPFFAAAAMAPPDGLGGAEGKPSDPLAWYAARALGTTRMMKNKALRNATVRRALGEISMTTNASTAARRVRVPVSRFGRYRS